WGTVVGNALHDLQGRRGDALLGAGDSQHLPATPLLLAQDGGAAKGIATLHRQRVIENVQDLHVRSMARCSKSSCCAAGASQPNDSAKRRTAAGPAAWPMASRQAAASASGERSVSSRPATASVTI